MFGRVGAELGCARDPGTGPDAVVDAADQEVEAEVELVVGGAVGEVRKDRAERRELVGQLGRDLLVTVEMILVVPARDQALLHDHEALDVPAEGVERLRGVAVGESGSQNSRSAESIARMDATAARGPRRSANNGMTPDAP